MPKENQAVFKKLWRPITKEPGFAAFVQMLRGLEAAPAGEFAALREGDLGKLILYMAVNLQLRAAILASPQLQLPVCLGGTKGVPPLGHARDVLRALVKIQADFPAP
jgi:hypothetical protein